LTTGAATIRESTPYLPDYVGGRALAAKIAWDEIPRGAAPYDPENRVIIATGPLTGTLAPTSGRTIMSSLSPRTYPLPWYTHSTLGGWFGAELKYAGYDALIVHGQAAAPVYLEIQDGAVKLQDAAALWGLDARETQLALKERYGARAQVLTIGPAGENLVRFATVQHSEDNAAGHSGFGAVWGSKRLKAVVVRGTGGVRVAHPEALLCEFAGVGGAVTTPIMGALQKNNRPKRPVCSQACPFNCVVSAYGRRGDGRLVPGLCIAGVWRSDSYMTETRYMSEQIYVPGGYNFPMTTEVELHELCNSLGMDVWFRLVMQPWLIRCTELGISEIRGFPIAPKDAAWFEGFMRQLAHREGLGAILADDLTRAMDELEGELPEELIRLGRELEFGFGFPAHREGRFWDEEPLPFWVISAMMYASESRDPTIGTHLSALLFADFVLSDPVTARRQFKALSQKTWGFDDGFEPTFENKAPVAVWSQDQHMLIDSLPMCDFAYPRLMRPFESREEWQAAEDVSGDLELDRRLFAAVTGQEWSRAEMTRLAERGVNLERMLLARAGRSRAMEEKLAPHFKLPCRADGTSIDAAGFSRLLDEFYAARGWDMKNGWPTEGKLRALGLGFAVEELNNT
jgi:aldehyde:ferredoxin oxidoreductase